MLLQLAVPPHRLCREIFRSFNGRRRSEEANAADHGIQTSHVIQVIKLLGSRAYVQLGGEFDEFRIEGLTNA
jgi:hypothetical protein